MSTVVLNAYSKAYPLITNRIRASVTLQSDPQALIDTIIDATSGHPQRIWSFPGLPRDNYGFYLDEIDAFGGVVNNLAGFDVVPGEIDGLLTRNDEQPQAGVTPGFVVGANSFTFDGSETSHGSGIFKPDYTGWEIVPSEINGGRGILVRGLDYSWDKTTAVFVLLQGGDIFPPAQFYNIHFEPIQNPAGNSSPTITDFSIRLITLSDTILVGDFANKIIVEPAEELVELALPDILTVPQGRKCRIEIGGLDRACVKLKPAGSTSINWLRGNVYAMPGESFSIYRFRRAIGDDEWRIDDADGNFKTVGETVGEDAVQTDVINKQILDGASLSINSCARLYNEYVLNLPGSQVVDYDDWATGNNKYLYSRANSADPGNLDKFHIPDKRTLFERNNSVGKAGDYATDTFKTFTGLVNFPYVQNFGSSLTRGLTDGTPAPGLPNVNITLTIPGGTETCPKNLLINKYVKL